MENSGLKISSGDNYYSSVIKMKDFNKSFDESLDNLIVRAEELNKTKITLSLDSKSFEQNLKKAKKNFKKTGDEASKMALEMAQTKYDNFNNNLKLVSENAQQAEKNIFNFSNAKSKADNKVDNKASDKEIEEAKEGLTKMAVDSGAKLVGAMISSSTNSSTGKFANSMLSGAVSGASLGTAIAPGIGTAIGAGIGLITGGINAIADDIAEKDEVFKSTVFSSVENMEKENQQKLAPGVAVSTQRQADEARFENLFRSEAKDSGEAAKLAEDYQNSLVSLANQSPYSYEELSKMTTMLKSNGYTATEGDNNIIDELKRIGNVSSALKWSESERNNAATILATMKSTDKVDENSMKTFENQGLPVIDYLVDHYKKKDNEAGGEKTNDQIREEVMAQIKEGSLSGSEFAEVISDSLDKNFNGKDGVSPKDYAALVSNLADIDKDIAEQRGLGFTDARTDTLEEKEKLYTGALGEEMKNVEYSRGRKEAALENTRDELEMRALSAVLLGEDLNSGKGPKFSEHNTTELNSLKEQYQSLDSVSDDGERDSLRVDITDKIAMIVEAEYNGSEVAQEQLESQIEMRDYTANIFAQNEDYYSRSLKLLNSISGRGGYVDILTETEEPAGDKAYPLDGETVESNNAAYNSYGEGFVAEAAWGLPYIPYDNYPVNLHEGERVLTASENREYSSMKNKGVSGGFTSADILGVSYIPKELYAQYVGAGVYSGGSSSTDYSVGDRNSAIKITGNTFNVREEADINKIASQLAAELKRAQMIT